MPLQFLRQKTHPWVSKEGTQCSYSEAPVCKDNAPCRVFADVGPGASASLQSAHGRWPFETRLPRGAEQGQLTLTLWGQRVAEYRVRGLGFSSQN